LERKARGKTLFGGPPGLQCQNSAASAYSRPGSCAGGSGTTDPSGTKREEQHRWERLWSPNDGSSATPTGVSSVVRQRSSQPHSAISLLHFRLRPDVGAAIQPERTAHPGSGSQPARATLKAIRKPGVAVSPSVQPTRSSLAQSAISLQREDSVLSELTSIGVVRPRSP